MINKAHLKNLAFPLLLGTSFLPGSKAEAQDNKIETKKANLELAREKLDDKFKSLELSHKKKLAKINKSFLDKRKGLMELQVTRFQSILNSNLQLQEKKKRIRELGREEEAELKKLKEEFAKDSKAAILSHQELIKALRQGACLKISETVIDKERKTVRFKIPTYKDQIFLIQTREDLSLKEVIENLKKVISEGLKKHLKIDLANFRLLRTRDGKPLLILKDPDGTIIMSKDAKKTRSGTTIVYKSAGNISRLGS